jgi:hypothetical protein
LRVVALRRVPVFRRPDLPVPLFRECVVFLT